MSLVRYTDSRLKQLLDSVSRFSYVSLLAALNNYDHSVHPNLKVDRKGDIVAWGLMVELNFATAVFSDYDLRFVRGNAQAREGDVKRLIQNCLRFSDLPKRMSFAAPSFGQDPKDFQTQLQGLLDRMHMEELTNLEYEWLNDLTKSFLGSSLVNNIPRLGKVNLPTTEELLEKISRQTYGLSFFDLHVLRQVLSTKIQNNSNFIREILDEPSWRLARPFILTPDDLPKITLDQLIIKQPLFYLNRVGEFRIHTLSRPIAYVRTLAYEEMQALASKHTNLEGMSMETFIEKYLGHASATFNPAGPDFVTHLRERFEVHTNIIIERQSARELFEQLEDPDKPQIEIDAVVNGIGFSLIVESKHCSHGGTARRYYLNGINEESERGFLTKIVTFLRRNPDAKSLFGIPRNNRIGGAFVTNQHGRFFSLDDGLLKLSVWEIYLEGVFERLITRSRHVLS